MQEVRVTQLHLRWYKSFNIRSEVAQERMPWDEFGTPEGSDGYFPFVSVAIDSEITTIVGANESGKSHLLSAISKTLSGAGIPTDLSSEGKPYRKQDICHFAVTQGKNASAWPQIGVSLSGFTAEDLKLLTGLVGNTAVEDLEADDELTVILAPDTGTYATIFLNANSKPVGKLDDSEWLQLRNALPDVYFIDSNTKLFDRISLPKLAELLTEQELEEQQSDRAVYNRIMLEELASEAATLSPVTIPPPPEAGAQPVPITIDKSEATKVNSIRKNAAEARIASDENYELELQLFRDLLKITPQAVREIADCEDGDASYVLAHASAWTDELDAVLNLSHYWQQDDKFQIRFSAREKQLFLEITDKTGKSYTFSERSSGLRYFLSYYIQAHSLAARVGDSPCVILMDEPDSFLSNIGQRNLLSVFQSLSRISPNTQLIYTTHSPFLIDRNFPSRLRLVRKGDGEEGSQPIDQPRVRRYEPVRSALGVDVAQTLFMGGLNIIVEGAVDQYYLCELIRIFRDIGNATLPIDLNKIVVVSADSVHNVHRVVEASHWADEPVPATVVVLDSDEPARREKEKLTRPRRHEFISDSSDDIREKEKKPLLGENHIVMIGDFLESQVTDATIEDIIPAKVFEEAVITATKGERSSTDEPMPVPAIPDKLTRNVDRGKFLIDKMFKDSVGLDKMGIAIEAVRLIRDRVQDHGVCRFEDGNEYFTDTVVDGLWKQLQPLVDNLRQKLDFAEKERQQESGQQATQKIVWRLLKMSRHRLDCHAVESTCNRVMSEAAQIGEDASQIYHNAAAIKTDVIKARARGESYLENAEYDRVRGLLERLAKEPYSELDISEPIATTEQVVPESTTEAEVTPADADKDTEGDTN